LTSVFTYAANGRMTSLTTPYGTTTFAEVNELPFGSDNVANRSMLVTEPGGRKHFYIYRNNSEKLNESPGAPDLLPVNYPAAEVPNTAPYPNSINTWGLEKSNSFYWGPNQYAALSAAFKTSENPIDLTLADYQLARSRNWLYRGSAGMQAGGVLNLERRPSPNGVIPGVTHFFLIVPFPKLASQGFRPGGRTGVVFCSRITALGSYAYDGAGQAKLRSQFWPDWCRILSALAS
jgi:hypothetical protein